MDAETLTRLAELLRAGWSLQVIPEHDPTLYVPRCQLLWKHPNFSEYPIADWVNLFHFEAEFAEAVEKFHARFIKGEGAP